MNKQSDQYYTGVIVEVIDPLLYEVKVDIPGFTKGASAYPMRGEVDEPKVGDLVLLRGTDTVFNSYYLYQKLKENDYIGFRSNGKMVDITPDYITIGIFDPSKDYSDKDRPDCTDWIKIDKNGNLDINMRADANITVNGNATIKAPNVKITGGTLEVTGKASNDMMGPFCAIPICPFTGAPHTGKTVSGT